MKSLSKTPTTTPTTTPRLISLTALTITLLTACGTYPNTPSTSSKSPTGNGSKAPIVAKPVTPAKPIAIETKTVTVINDPATLEQGISRPAQTLQLKSVGKPSGGKPSGELAASAFIENPWRFELIASVAPPTTANGVEVRATHITFNGKYAIVTYNREGPTFAGALEVYDISNSSHPVRISQALFDDMDANVVSSPDEDLTGTTNGRLYVGGARKIARTNHLRPAVLSEFSISHGQLGTSVKSIELDGYSTNSIARYGPLVMTSSGNADCDNPTDPLRGGVAVTRTNIFETGSPLEGLKLNTFCHSQAVAVHHAGYFETSYLAALEAGSNAKLHVYDMTVPYKSNPSLLLNTNKHTFNIGNVNPVDNKNSMDIDRGLVWVAAGNAGVKAFSLSTYSSTPAYTLSAEDASGLAANSISIDGATAYVAFGNGGVYVTRIPQCDDPTKIGVKHVNCNSNGKPLENKALDWYGKFSDVGGSANFVAAKNCLIFIASGEGGLRIVRKIQ
jgi:hypothetical protein